MKPQNAAMMTDWGFSVEQSEPGGELIWANADRLMSVWFDALRLLWVVAYMDEHSKECCVSFNDEQVMMVWLEGCLRN